MQSVGGASDTRAKGGLMARGPNRDKDPIAKAGGNGLRRGKKSAKRAEAPLQVNPKKVSFALLDETRHILKASQGRTYWSALCNPPLYTNGITRSAKFSFAPWQSAAGAVGMLPPTVREDDLGDWLGYQLESAAVWLDGGCRRNGRKLNNVAAAAKAATEGDLLVCTHSGTKLTISRDGQIIKTFYNVPADWVFAMGAFGGKVGVMRDCDEDPGGRHHLSRLVFGSITVSKVPDGDMGPGRSDVFVEFELLLGDSSPTAPFADGRPRLVQTNAVAEVNDTVEFPDSVLLPLPGDYVKFGGMLSITLYDDDLKSADSALGRAIIPLTFTPEQWTDDQIVIDHLVLKGELQSAAAGCEPR